MGNLPVPGSGFLFMVWLEGGGCFGLDMEKPSFLYGGLVLGRGGLYTFELWRYVGKEGYRWRFEWKLRFWWFLERLWVLGVSARFGCMCTTLSSSYWWIREIRYVQVRADSQAI